mgnify:CR=1 FL=1
MFAEIHSSAAYGPKQIAHDDSGIVEIAVTVKEGKQVRKPCDQRLVTGGCMSDFQRVLHGKVQFLTLLKRLILSQGWGNGSLYQSGLKKGVQPIKCTNLLHEVQLSGTESKINLKVYIFFNISKGVFIQYACGAQQALRWD